MTKSLTLDKPTKAVNGSAVAFRCRTELQPAGVREIKYFPLHMRARPRPQSFTVFLDEMISSSASSSTACRVKRTAWKRPFSRR